MPHSQPGVAQNQIEDRTAYWLISGLLKTVLEGVDPEGFAFARCEVRLADEAAGPPYWLCDTLRALDALDEAESRVRIECDHVKIYNLAGGAHLVFREDVVGSAHVFRLAHFRSVTFCDQELKEACKAARLKGIKFKEFRDAA